MLSRLITPKLTICHSGFGGGGGGSRTWGNREALPDHFDRHGNDFGAPNEENYAQQANRFFQERDRYQVKTDIDGIIRVYDPETNTFGSYNSDGTTRTFFKPRGGQRYFDNQPGE